MAQSIQEIYNNIININNAYPELADITNTNTSDMGLLQTMYYIVATEMQLQQQYMDQLNADLQAIADRSDVATASWWQNQMLNVYQYSADPNFGNIIATEPYGVLGYASVDENLRIIKYASVTSATNRKDVTIKVAKQVAGLPAQLNNDELNSVKAFVDAKQPIGLNISTVSFPADNIKLDISVYYNAQYVESVVLANIKNAINEYFNTLAFDGAILLNKIIDVCQSVPGVNDITINSAFGKSDATSYTAINRRYITYSGYCNLDLTNSTFTLINSL